MPGDHVYLAAGQTHAPFVGHGSGSFPVALAESTYASAYTTARAASVAGADYANVDAKAGSTASGEYADGVANRVALQAVRAAVENDPGWITVTRYGSGANPIIDGGGTAEDGVQIVPQSTGGWKFKSLRIQNATTTGIYYANLTGWVASATYTGPANGFWVEDFAASGITGAMGPVATGVGAKVPNRSLSLPTGLGLVGLNYVFVTDANLSGDDIDTAHEIVYGQMHLLERITSTNTRVCHPWLYYSTRSALVDCTYREQGRVTGYPNGTAGFFLLASKNVTIKNSKFLDTKRPTNPWPPYGVSPDGVGFDYEAGCNYVVWEAPSGAPGDGNELSGNYGEGFLFFANGGVYNPPGPANTHSVFVGLKLENNGKQSPSLLVAGGRYQPSSTTFWWVDTVFTRSHASQKKWDLIGSTSPATDPTDTTPAAWVEANTTISGP